MYDSKRVSMRREGCHAFLRLLFVVYLFRLRRRTRTTAPGESDCSAECEEGAGSSGRTRCAVYGVCDSVVWGSELHLAVLVPNEQPLAKP